MRQIKALVVHCSATPPSQDIDAKEIGRRQRQPPQNFDRIGYHYVIRRDGTTEVGRKETETGAHARDGGYNNFSLGVCLVGGVDDDLTPENNFTPAQMAALKALIVSLKAKYHRIAILGHRDIPGVKKACPSFDVKSWLHEVGLS